MPTRIFLVPEAGSGTSDDPLHPKYADSITDGRAGGFPVGSTPAWVLIATADSATLDSIAVESDTNELTESEANDRAQNDAPRVTTGDVLASWGR